MRQDQFHRLLTDCPILAKAPAGAAHDLASSLQRKSYSRGDSIYAEGDPADQVFLIQHGKVRIGRTACDRAGRVILDIRAPTEVFGEVDALTGPLRTTWAVAHTEALILVMSNEALRDWLRAHPAVDHLLLRFMAARLRRAQLRLAHARCEDIDRRVAHALLQHWRDYGTARRGLNVVELDRDHDEVGQCHDISREQVYATLTGFQRRGWIRIEGRLVHILEPAQFTRFAEEFGGM
ncbi:Crp/Fnr family transcriptional regulator [Crossiella sp. CA-258035]|uniref:Crp/Fnr family transcriptional regulator n=1 Tax=Crossiella sp. CA-258035 TaxID=2981138 RepID=UPI0024BCCABF|nr:Crp/Fnr family transcriptional regulator [Crossiella sp. CA-258035]WHT22625.1 Crp/Fnr family transcriptional regulator [Crossiella sp. CA-258035]